MRNSNKTIRKTIFKVLSFIILLNCLFLLSCNTFNNKEIEQDIPNSVIVYDDNQETEYSVSIVNSKDKSIMLIKTDENGKIDSFDYISLVNQKKVTAAFNEDGLLSGIGTEGATIAFSNYNGNKVDIAVISNDETFIIKGYESPSDWNNIKNQFYINLSSCSVRGENSISNENLKKTWNYIGQQFVNIGEVILDFKDNENPQKVALNFLVKIIKDSGLFLIDNTSRDLEYSNFFFEMYLLALKAPTSPWGALYLLCSNYDTYVKFVEDVTYSLIEMHDRFFNDQNNGLGALNSGFGELKVTMSWNFYADIDLHAIEPSGTHIYWDNPKSSVSNGFLDVDNRVGGNGAMENIYWNKAEDGSYEIFINYYGESISNHLTQSGQCTVSLFYNGQGKTFKIPLNVKEYKPVAVVSLPTGVISNHDTRVIIKFINQSKDKSCNNIECKKI